MPPSVIRDSWSAASSAPTHQEESKNRSGSAMDAVRGAFRGRSGVARFADPSLHSADRPSAARIEDRRARLPSAVGRRAAGARLRCVALRPHAGASDHRSACRGSDPTRRGARRRGSRRQPGRSGSARWSRSCPGCRRTHGQASCSGPSAIASSPRSAARRDRCTGRRSSRRASGLGMHRDRWCHSPPRCSCRRDGIARRGRCSVGDKTILDTLRPAAPRARATPSRRE